MNLGSTIWINGALVASDEATVHVVSHGLHYGAASSKACARIRRRAVPSPPAHDDPYDVDELCIATAGVIASNGFTDCYVRPIAFYGRGELRVASRANPTDVSIMTWPMGTYFGEATLAEGIRAKISSWRRVDVNTIPHAAKAYMVPACTYQELANPGASCSDTVD